MWNEGFSAVKHYKAFILKVVQTALPLKQPHPASDDPRPSQFQNLASFGARQVGRRF